MFKDAIVQVGQYTRPIHFISHVYGDHQVRPGAATLFFVNDKGEAITCKHVTQLLLQMAGINQRYHQFKTERQPIHNYPERVRQLAERYGYDAPDALCEIFYQMVDCADFTSLDVIEHPQYDLAIVRPKGFTRLGYQGHAVFAKDSSELQPGLFLCRLGYPFPEFSNFTFDSQHDTIHWTQDPSFSVRFPLEGMVTRHFGDRQGNIYGVEISTPGLKGQSGGPLFDAEGRVYGMQSLTHHLHLGFDMREQEVYSEGRRIRVTNQPMLHVGHCVHMDVIKNFLREHNVQFDEADS